MCYLIIGTGNISNTYVNAIRNGESSETREIVGCISRSKTVFAPVPELPVWQSLESVDKPYEAVVVATPNGEHHKGIIAAAAAGKHVLVEKPLDISLDAIDSAIAACKRAGVTLAVAFQHRTAPDNQAIKRLLEAGAFGRVFAVDLAAKFYRDQAYYDSGDYRGGYTIDGGGPFMQQASHNLDIYTWFFGVPTTVVSMLDTFNHTIEAEDHGAALLRHTNGIIGTVVASTVAKPGYSARMEVHTEKGSFTLTDHHISDWQVDGVANPANTAYVNNHDGAKSAAVTDTTAHQAIIKDFENVIEKGGTPLASAASARCTTELILAVYNNKQ